MWKFQNSTRLNSPSVKLTWQGGFLIVLKNNKITNKFHKYPIVIETSLYTLKDISQHIAKN